MAISTTETTFDGTVIPAVISSTAHLWTADATGLFTTTADLRAEWTADEAVMLAGHGDTLSPLARLEANAEAILDNTAAIKLSTTNIALLRLDLQREFDAIGAAMQMNQTLYGIDPTKPFNTYSYYKMEQTLQGNEALQELAYQGHGVNNPADPRYAGFTTNFQNRVDGKTFYVGGGPGSGERAIANFLDDDVLSHAPFPTVMHNGVLTQLNQNGNLEDTTADAVMATNNAMFFRVLVAGDFSTNSAATGPVVLVPNAAAIPAPPALLPVPVGTLPTQIQTYDGSIVASTITSTAHQWSADATGLFLTWSDLAAEWKGYEATMLAGHAAMLTPLQRQEGNAEAVFDNTRAGRLLPYAQNAFRQDLQREFDVIDAAMKINQTLYGIDANAALTGYSMVKLEQTIDGNELLKELATQGHGLNSPPFTRYDGYTTDFQNRTDGSTFYVGGGFDNGENAISAFLDDVGLTHGPFPVVMHNGVLTQLNQNGNQETALANAVAGMNSALFTRVFVAGDFSADKNAVGPVVLVQPGAVAAGTDALLSPSYYAVQASALSAPGTDLVSEYHSLGWTQGLNPNAWFDTNYYLAQNPDVKAAGVDPLAHFEANGWREGRDPSLLFSDAKYLAANPDVAAAGVDPLMHYTAYGQAESRAAFLAGGVAAADPLIQSAYYDQQLGATLIPSGTAAEQQAAWSYDSTGWMQGLNPDAFFNTAYYLSHNPDIAAAHIDPLMHYEQYGWKEGRDPSAQFSTTKYLAAYADVKAAGMDPLLHFVAFGQAEGRMAFTT